MISLSTAQPVLPMHCHIPGRVISVEGIHWYSISMRYVQSQGKWLLQSSVGASVRVHW